MDSSIFALIWVVRYDHDRIFCFLIGCNKLPAAYMLLEPAAWPKIKGFAAFWGIRYVDTTPAFCYTSKLTYWVFARKWAPARFFLCPLKKPIDRGKVVSQNDEPGDSKEPALENGDQSSYHSNNHENDPKCNSKCVFHDIIII